MNGPAERAASAAGLDGPSRWTDYTVDVQSVDVNRFVIVVRHDDGRELGRASIRPSMVGSLNDRPGAFVMVRLLERAPE